MLANRINRVRIKNYRGVDDELIFEDLTVLVGPNSSGKSNIVDALRFVRDALSVGLDVALSFNYRDSLDYIVSYVSDNSPDEFSIDFDLTINGKAAKYNITISKEEIPNYWGVIKEESCSIDNNYFRLEKGIFESSEGWRVFHNENGLPLNEFALKNLYFWAKSSDLDILMNVLSKSGFYSITPDVFRPPQVRGKVYPLNEYGTNLMSVLNEFIVNDSEWLSDLNENLALVVPELKSENTIEVQDASGYLIGRLNHKNGSQFALAHESDGTLRILGILTTLYQNPPLPLTAIEEPELGIHPHAIGVLADVLSEASRRTQLLLTTHSPDLISRFSPESLRLVERDEKDGSTKVGKITPANIASVEEKLFSSGDLLRIGAMRRDQ